MLWRAYFGCMLQQDPTTGRVRIYRNRELLATVDSVDDAIDWVHDNVSAPFPRSVPIGASDANPGDRFTAA